MTTPIYTKADLEDQKHVSGDLECRGCWDSWDYPAHECYEDGCDGVMHAIGLSWWDDYDYDVDYLCDKCGKEIW